MGDESDGELYRFVLIVLTLLLVASLPSLMASSDSLGPLTETKHSDPYPDVEAQLLDTEIDGKDPIRVGVNLERGFAYGEDPDTEAKPYYVYLSIGGTETNPEYVLAEHKAVWLAPRESKHVVFEVPFEEEIYDRGHSKSTLPVRVYGSPSSYQPDIWTVLHSRDTNNLGNLIVRPNLFDWWRFWGVVVSSLGILVTLYRSRKFHGQWKKSVINGIEERLDEIQTASTESQSKSWSIQTLLTNHSPYEFEQVIERLYRANGYMVNKTSKSGDAGLDVLAKKDGVYVGVQVKRYSPGNNVGSPEVQNAVGAGIQQGCDEVVMVTTSDYTRPAKSAAQATSQNGITVTLVNGRSIVQELNRYL